VVAGLDLEVPAGSWLSVVGTNGSGKSTFLRTLVGLLRPVGGDLEVAGRPPGRAPRRVSYLAQSRKGGFVLPLRARDVVRMGRYSRRGLLGRMTDEDDEACAAAMAAMGVTDLARRALGELSGGQQQRVHLAQALARRADVLVLDEPTSGLDAASRVRYLDAVAGERARGAAVVAATHDVGEAARADRVLLLAGRVVALGPPAEVLTAPNLLATFGIALEDLPGGLVVVDTGHHH
jgi:ABC-type Mn2+/Zn2+ transport system ATPase subunit